MDTAIYDIFMYFSTKMYISEMWLQICPIKRKFDLPAKA